MYYELNPEHTDRRRLQAERDKARQLRTTPWWKEKLRQGICGYCHQSVGADALTMDHVVPLARGGSSTKNNIVASCKPCNAAKRLETPVERLLRTGL